MTLTETIGGVGKDANCAAVETATSVPATGWRGAHFEGFLGRLWTCRWFDNLDVTHIQGRARPVIGPVLERRCGGDEQFVEFMLI